MMSYDWKRHKIGLVLSGGGAKGAYEIGCWEAFQKECLPQFEAISGTSIGGINAFLFAQGELDSALDLWREMGRKTPLRMSLIRITLALLERFGLAIFFAMHLYVLLPIVAFISMIIGAVIPACLIYYVLPASLAPLRILILPFLLCCFLGMERIVACKNIGRFSDPKTPYSRLAIKRYLRQSSFLGFSVFSGFLLGVVLPVSLSLYDLIRGFPAIWAALLIPCFLLSLLVMILNYEFGVSSPGELSFISGKSLQSVLKHHIQKYGPLPESPVVYVTRLREESVYLPGRIPGWVEEKIRRIMEAEDWSLADIPMIRRLMDEQGLTEFCSSSSDIALGMEYLKLNDQPRDKTTEFLVSTAAIAGFLPRVVDQLSEYEELDWIQGTMKAVFYDAGMIDNTPIVPLLEKEDCDLIIVIFLDQSVTNPKTYLEKEVELINERIRRKNHHLDDEMYEQLNDIRFLRPVRIKTSRLKETVILPIVPSRNLGGFFRGTLKFKEDKVESLIRMGRKDADRALKEFVKMRLGQDDQG